MSKNKIIIVSLLIFLILFISLFFLTKGKKQQTKDDNNNQGYETQKLIPTVDSSVQVELKSLKKGEVVLKINNPPKNTETVDFELSYLVENSDLQNEGGQGLVSQGVIGSCYLINKEYQCGEESFQGRKIILGTCSSGVCRYHNIKSPIKVTLKFNGLYGEKIFEKEFDL